MTYIFNILFVIAFTIAFNSKDRKRPPRYWAMEKSDSLKIRAQLDSMIAVK